MVRALRKVIMRAIVATPGSTAPRVITTVIPTAGPGEVLIRVHASVVNPVDAWVLTDSGRDAFRLSGQFGIGWDLAGTVAAPAEGLAEGTPVAATFTALGSPTAAHAEYAVVPRSAVAAIPEGVTMAAAATVALNALTARQALDALGAPDGRLLLVTGAAGAVGGYALALAVADGWQVTGLARASDREFVTSQGAEFTSDPGKQVFDAVLDAAGLAEAILPAIVDNGAYLSLLPPFPVTGERGIDVDAILVQGDGEALTDLLARTATGELPVRIAQVHDLTNDVSAETAWRQAVGSGRRGRQVATWV